MKEWALHESDLDELATRGEPDVRVVAVPEDAQPTVMHRLAGANLWHQCGNVVCQVEAGSGCEHATYIRIKP